jgi:hypothetical protein
MKRRSKLGLRVIRFGDIQSPNKNPLHLSLCLCVLVAVLSTGCTIIPNDMGYPTFHSYWSPAAKEYRVGKEQAKEWASESKPKVLPAK